MNFLEHILKGEKLVSDGATGTNLQQRGLAMGQAAERWVLERPDEIVRLHKDFILAGSDIILTCTFGGTHIRLESSGLGDQAVEINCKAVELARRAAAESGVDRPVFVAGSIGPTGHLLKPLGPLEEEVAAQNFQDQARTLVEAGVDLLVIETQFDLTEASLAIKAARSVTTLPIVCSFSYDRGTRTMMGVKPAQMAAEASGWGVDVVGINCGRSLDENIKALQELKSNTDLPIWFKPNAGMPALDAAGRPVYSLTPEDMGHRTAEWMAAGASIMGGCCGTSPEHLGAIARQVKS